MNLNRIVLSLGIVSLVVGIISRLTMVPVPPAGIQAGALLQFAGVCFLLVIALSVMQCKK